MAYSAQYQEGDRRFMRAAMDTPLLEREEEQNLARRWQNDDDEAALHRIVTSHARLVLKLARRFRGYGLPFGDLVQEGNTGLMEAAARFDPERGVRFSTYSSWWITAAMQSFVLRNWSIVRTGTTPAQRRLFFNLRRLRAQIDDHARETMTDDARQSIADTLKVPVAAVERMETRFARPDRSLNAPVADQATDSLQDLIADTAPRPDEIVIARRDAETRADRLRAAVARLNERERAVIESRFFDERKITLAEIGERFGVSKERIRQIEGKAITKLHGFLLEGNIEPADLLSH